MKTGFWVMLLTLLLIVCGGLSLLLLTNGQTASGAEIYSGGELVKTVMLNMPQEFTVTGPNGGVNTLTVSDAGIAVTEASCPDHYCMKRGFCNGGAEIVCLPNALVIRFVGQQEVDGVAGQ